MDTIYLCPKCGEPLEQGEYGYDYETGIMRVDHCPCCDCEEGEPCNIKEDMEIEIYDGTYGKNTLKEEGLEVVTWPESQEIMEIDGFEEHAKLINDSYGLKRFGSAAYVVESEWLKENISK